MQSDGVIPLGVRRETRWVEVPITSAWGGNGDLVSDTTDSTYVTVRNIGNFAFEFRVNDGLWTRLELRNSIRMNVSLQTSSIRLRKSEFGGDALVRLEIESLTSVFSADDHQLNLGGGAGAGAFTDLTDAPQSYTGKAGRVPVVNAAQDGLEFHPKVVMGSNTLKLVRTAVAEEGAGNTVMGVESEGVEGEAPYASVLSSTTLHPTDPGPLNAQVEMYVSEDGGDSTSLMLRLTPGGAEIAETNISETGASTAVLTPNNAPADISPKKWLKFTIDGVPGWIPWFST